MAEYSPIKVIKKALSLTKTSNVQDFSICHIVPEKFGNSLINTWEGVSFSAKDGLLIRYIYIFLIIIIYLSLYFHHLVIDLYSGTFSAKKNIP